MMSIKIVATEINVTEDSALLTSSARSPVLLCESVLDKPSESFSGPSLIFPPCFSYPRNLYDIDVSLILKFCNLRAFLIKLFSVISYFASQIHSLE
jgi:hypothetical protein